MNDKKSAITALVFSLLMLITPMASAANVTTFLVVEKARY